MKTKLLLIAAITLVTLSGCEKELNPADPGNLVPKTVDQDPSLPAISVNNTMLHAEAFGNPDSAMIVVLHGGPGVDYRSVLNAKELAEDGYYVVFFDQRGCGLSRRHEKNVYNIQLPVEDLKAVIQHYRRSPLQKIFLLGHSWGAMLATEYINNYPTEINGVILMEPGGFNWEDTKAYIERTRDIPITSEEASDAFYSGQIITGKENDQEILDYKFILSASIDSRDGNTLGNAGPVPFWRYGAVINNAMIDIAEEDGFDFTTNLNQYHTKALYLYSELNKAYGYDHAHKVSSAYPNVQLEQINGCGHEMIYFGWNNVHPLVLNYLNSLK